MRLAENNLVNLIWVPGHAEVQGNEIADELARGGSARDYIGPEPALPLTISWAKAMINKEAHNKHIQYWKNLFVCQHSKLFLREPLGAAARNIFNMSKRRLRTLVGTVTGHFPCDNHLHNLGLRQDKLCSRCNSDVGTMYHLVCLCPSLANRRYRMLGDYVLNLQELQQLKLTKIVDFVTPLFAETSASNQA
jgi:hypothetical protein